jgi:CheY-like chemotaxis protein
LEQPPLEGHSILVVEDEPFIARCLQIVLQGAGAEVHRTTCVGEAWTLTDQHKLSAAVLDCKHGIRSDHTIARRLAERGLPFVFYGASTLAPHDAWPNAPVMGKLTSGAEIVKTLRGLLQPRQPSVAAVAAAGVGAPKTNAHGMAAVHVLMKGRRSGR